MMLIIVSIYCVLIIFYVLLILTELCEVGPVIIPILHGLQFAHRSSRWQNRTQNLAPACAKSLSIGNGLWVHNRYSPGWYVQLI